MNYESQSTVLLRNTVRKYEGISIGGANPTRLGVLLGITKGMTTVDMEWEKAQLALKNEVSTFTDLTTDGSNLLRKRLVDNTNAAIGTVPMYEFYHNYSQTCKKSSGITRQFMDVAFKQGNEGVDFFSVQLSLTQQILSKIKTSSRTIPITSRGGAMVAEIISKYNMENPILQCYDELLKLCREYQITLSFVGALRPGCMSDAFENLHIEELRLQSELARKAKENGVNVIIELINHVPLNLLTSYCKLSHDLFDGLPYGALGPSPTDIAVGYDDIAGAIGAAQVSMNGISWINLVTGAEHTYFPTITDLERALKYYRIALHIGHVARTGNLHRDNEMALYRSDNNWNGIANASIFSEESSNLLDKLGYKEGSACTLCNNQCPLVRMKSVNKILDSKYNSEGCLVTRH